MDILEVINLFTQGDGRYSLDYADIVKDLINKKAVIFETYKERQENKWPTKEDRVNGHQEFYKLAIVKNFSGKGYNLISYERRYVGSIADVAMEKGDELLLIECGPCRINKVIDYLELNNTKLVIVDLETNDNEIVYHIFERGEKWDIAIKLLNDWKRKS